MADQAEVEFNQPVLPEDVTSLPNKYKVKISKLESDFIIGPTKIHDFYVEPKAGTATQLESDYAQNRLDYFADVVASEAEMPAKERSELQPRLDAMKAALEKRDSGSVRVSKVTFSGELSVLQQLAQSGIPAKVKIIDKGLMKELMEKKMQHEKQLRQKDIIKQSQKPLSIQRLLAALNPVSLLASVEKPTPLVAQSFPVRWYPDLGVSYVYPSANGGRYTRQTMSWGRNYFRSEETYEHDFFLYNYDRATYLDPITVGYPDCYPNSVYASTTWPAGSAPYLDTRFGQNSQCEVDELAYTLGAAYAYVIPQGMTHETYIRTANGNAGADKFKLIAQLGYRSPVTCDSTFCSFGKSSRVLVPAWSINVPNTKYWP